ncbi:MAG: PAS domain S-box protein, partial [Candidatus Ratteibacteria bacterium]|nr:PAS domain S-box protein [Candidatus Ratteibacteria bacterium]
DGQITGIRSTMQDITQHKQDEEEIKREKEFTESIFNTAPVIILVLDTKANIINFNSYMENLTDYKLEEVKGKNWFDTFLPEKNREQTKNIFSKTLSNMPASGNINPIITKDGREVLIEWYNKTLKDKNGQIIGIIATGQDITKRKQTEELSKALFEYNPIETIVVNTKGEIIDFNLAKKISGSRLPQKGDIMYKDYAGKHEIDMHAELMGCISSGKTKTFPEQKYKGKILTITIAPFPKGAIITSQDITERKFVEEALRASEERYRELWNNAPVAYHTLDTRGIITSVNSTEAKMLEYKPEEMLGKPIFDFILPEQKAEAKQRFLQKLKGKRIPEAKDRIYVTNSGKKIHVSIDEVWEYDNEGEIIGVRTTMLDITDRKKAEEEREKSFKQLQKNFEETIMALVSAVEIRDLYTAGHQKRVTELACAIAKEMDLSNSQIASIKMAGLVHDIGKIAVPAEILGKPSKLNETEMDLVRTHVTVGYDILKTIEFPWPVAQIVLQHHERINGTGYPKGLKGDEILLEARILSVADVIEAIATYRPYHEAFGIDTALEEISKNKGILYDPKVVDVCIKLFKEKRFKFNS